MARYDAYLNSDGRGWLLDVQANELSSHRTRIVIPLVPLGQGFEPTSRLNPVLDTPSGRMVLATELLFAVPRSLLRDPEFSLADEQDRIKSALDLAFYGF